MVPFNVAFKAHDQRRQLIIADCIVEVFFIVDIVINFRTTYIDKKSGRIITQKKMIAMHYLKRWFIVDFLAALPFEALYFIDHSWVRFQNNLFPVSSEMRPVNLRILYASQFTRSKSRQWIV